VNSKRIHRLCRSEGLKVPQTVRNKRAIGVSANACDVRKAGHLLGTDNEGTVDSSHPTDLGFWRQADAMEPVLRGIVGE